MKFPKSPVFITLNKRGLKFQNSGDRNKVKTELFENAMTKCPAAGHGLKKTKCPAVRIFHTISTEIKAVSNFV